MTNETQPILSVCIPTYNRRADLELAVKSALAVWRPEIEILISDNCSGDETELYCRELVEKYPQVRYNRNAENIGPDGNFLFLLQNANGKYIQILSDDDEVRCADIDGFLEFLRNNDFALGELYTTMKDAETPPEKSENHLYTEKEICSFVCAHGVNLTFVSALLFNRECFRKIDKPEQYKFTNLLQTHLAAAMLEFDKRTADINSYYVSATRNLSGGYNIYEVFIKNWREVVLGTMLRAGLPKRFLKKQFRRDLPFSYRYLVLEKAKGIEFRTKPKWRYFKYSLCYGYGWFVVLPTLLTPKFIVKVSYRLYRKIKHKK